MATLKLLDGLTPSLKFKVPSKRSYASRGISLALPECDFQPLWISLQHLTIES